MIVLHQLLYLQQVPTYCRRTANTTNTMSEPWRASDLLLGGLAHAREVPAASMHACSLCKPRPRSGTKPITSPRTLLRGILAQVP